MTKWWRWKRWRSCEVVLSWHMELAKYEKNVTKLWHVNTKNTYSWQSDGCESMKELRNGTTLAHRVSKIWKTWQSYGIYTIKTRIIDKVMALKRWKSCEMVQSWHMELVKYQKKVTMSWHVNTKNTYIWQRDGGETLKELRNGTTLAHRVSKIWKTWQSYGT